MIGGETKKVSGHYSLQMGNNTVPSEGGKEIYDGSNVEYGAIRGKLVNRD